MEIGDTIYSIINAIGREKIQSDITSDRGLSRDYIKTIIDQCVKIIGATDAETMGSLSEALLHFMLTVSTLPSTRKVKLNKIDLDVVIPNLHTLRNSPDKALIIQISKDNNHLVEGRLSNLTSIQPNYRNLWIVSSKPLTVACINYTIGSEKKATPSAKKRNFNDIIMDIGKFLEETGDRSLRFFQ
jgi:hypothetical protein